ncbi:MAG: hypothetical protein HFH03_01860 [Dorea sp.]|nr:hypothetical protein [Dorea sp.]
MPLEDIDARQNTISWWWLIIIVLLGRQELKCTEDIGRNWKQRQRNNGSA